MDVMKAQFQEPRLISQLKSAAANVRLLWLWLMSSAPVVLLVLACASFDAQGTPPITSVDWGDAPSPYPTMLRGGGARHTIVPGFSLGTSVDGETDGRPSANADGDDLNPAGSDDENGVTFPTLVPGQTASISIFVSDGGLTAGPRRVDLFLDFNRNGSWLDAGEYFSFISPAVGLNHFSIAVPSAASLGRTYARVRLSRTGTNLPTGAAQNGEVEDYLLNIAGFDFGDAPDSIPFTPGYPTFLQNDGARHRIVSGVHLGASVDRDANGQANADATGDDLNPASADDEDGVVFLTDLIAGQPVVIQVTPSVAGFLDAWIDFDRDLQWELFAGEKIFSSRPLNPGANILVFTVPSGAVAGETFARFRFSTLGDLNFKGEAADGEVEDYKVSVVGELLDFGDAPQPLGNLPIAGYPTRLPEGARHQIIPGFRLGEAADGEPDGQPNNDASGDDVSGQPDDEDGVLFTTPLSPGQSAQVRVIASAPGRLDGWIDFNGNRSWLDAGDRVFNAAALNAGVNILNLLVPESAIPGVTFARFRFSRSGGLEPSGYGGPGEVEDFQITIQGRPNQGCDGGCGGSDFWLTFPGNYAPDPANPVEPTLLIVGAPGTKGKISMPAHDPGAEVPFTIGAEGSLKFIVAKNDLLGSANDLAPDNGIRNFGVHVTTDNGALVNVYGLSRVHQTSDGFLALPTEALGLDYFVQSFANVQTGVPSLNGSQLAIVAAAPGETKVTITPSVVTGAHDSGVAYTISLMQGQTYQLRNTYNAPSDLSGTRVQSDQPIAVFGSHRCANVESSDAFYCDYLVEELLPVSRLGTEYYTQPLATRTGGDIVRILATEDNTVVQINGASLAPLNRGKSHQVLLTQPAQIKANHRVSVVQYATSSDHDNVLLADPFMVQVQHKKQFSTSYRFTVAQDDLNDGFPDHFVNNYINVIAPTAAAAANAVLLDGAPIPAAAFSAIGVTGFSGASVPVSSSPPVHTVTAPEPVGVIVYGWSEFDSYAWPACFNLGDTRAPVLICPEPVTTILASRSQPSAAPSNCTVPIPDFTSVLVEPDPCDLSQALVVTQKPEAGMMVGPGTHKVTVSAVDANGNVGTCQTTFTVVDPNSDLPPRFTESPRNITTPCTSSSGAIVNYTVIALAGCTPVEVECNPPSGSLFPIGATHVVCRIKNNVEIAQEFDVTVTCDLIGIQRTGGQVSLNWTPGGVLQVANQPTGPWTDAPASAVGQTSVSAHEPQKFYRFRK